MITHVAIIYLGKTYSLPKPNRHHHVIRLIAEELGIDHVGQGEQGFLDDTGRFLRRKPALYIALKSGQVIKGKRPSGDLPELYSEDLW